MARETQTSVMALGQAISALGHNVICALALASLTGGCDEEAPHIRQLECAPDNQSPRAHALVLLIDSGRHEVTIANRPGAPRTDIAIDRWSYRFAAGKAGQVTIGRFDGKMELRRMNPPGSTHVVAVWSCKAATTGPSL